MDRLEHCQGMDTMRLAVRVRDVVKRTRQECEIW